ncbi:MAG: hypothetical protein PW791_12610 [Neorhizobium sp.]|nr:hypothetical protein [Neorhizobium sp.]
MTKASGRRISTPPTTTECAAGRPGILTNAAILFKPFKKVDARGNKTGIGAFPRRNSTAGVFMTGSNNLYLVIGALLVVVIGLGGYVYHEQTKPKGVELSIGQDGVKVQEK